MSFNEPRDDPARRPAARRAPRRPTGAGGRGTDDQTLLVRRLVGLAIVLLLVLLLVLAVRAFLNAREERAYRDYVRDASALVEESNQQSDNLFGLLREPGDQGPVDLRESVNSFRVQAEQLVERARDTDPPDDVVPAHEQLVSTLEFRRDGIGGIARELPSALAEEGRDQANARIAAEMQSFLASDVIYRSRYQPGVRRALTEQELQREVRVPDSRFLPDTDWLSEGTIDDRVTAIAEGESPAPDEEEEDPGGLRGSGLGAIAVQPSGQQLSADAAADIPISEDLAFEVEVVNQGESELRDLPVSLTISGAGDPIVRETRIDAVAPGETATATIQLAEQPPASRPVTLEFTAEPVRGEETTDNNTAEFDAVFSSG